MDYALLSKVVEAKTGKAIIYLIRFKILPRWDFRIFTFVIKNSFISKNPGVEYALQLICA